MSTLAQRPVVAQRPHPPGGDLRAGGAEDAHSAETRSARWEKAFAAAVESVAGARPPQQPRTLFEDLQGWGLSPSWTAGGVASRDPAPGGTASAPSPWSAPHALLVLSSRAQSRARPLSSVEAHPARSEASTAARAAWADRCLSEGSLFGGEVGGRGEDKQPAGRLPLARVDTRPDTVSSHCYALHYAVEAFVESLAVKHGLESEGHAGYPPARWGWHDGPWVEDYWRATFARPLRRRMELVEYIRGFTRHGLRAINVSAGSTTIDIHVLSALRDAPSGCVSTAHYTPAEAASRAVMPHPPCEVDVEAPFDAALFHPLCPLFFPWENFMWHTMTVLRDIAPIEKLAALLVQRMKPEVQYVTLVQRAAGPWLLQDAGTNAGFILSQALRNTVVISAGGTGHVPIPLLARELPYLGTTVPGGHPHALSFIGAHRLGSRSWMLDVLSSSPLLTQGRALVLTPSQLADALREPTSGRALLAAWGMVADAEEGGGGGAPHYGVLAGPGGVPIQLPVRGENEVAVATVAATMANNSHAWVRAMAGGAYALAPRGTGPTSFRLFEALQLGIPPVYVYSSAPWLPYLKRGQSPVWVDGLRREQQSLWAQIGVVLPMRELEGWVEALHHALEEEEEEERLASKAGVRRGLGDVSATASTPPPSLDGEEGGLMQPCVRRDGAGGRSASKHTTLTGRCSPPPPQGGVRGAAAAGGEPPARGLSRAPPPPRAAVPPPGSADYDGVKASIAAVRDSHFTMEGLMRHLAALFTDPELSELDCGTSVGLL